MVRQWCGGQVGSGGQHAGCSRARRAGERPLEVREASQVPHSRPRALTGYGDSTGMSLELAGGFLSTDRLLVPRVTLTSILWHPSCPPHSCSSPSPSLHILPILPFPQIQCGHLL